MGNCTSAFKSDYAKEKEYEIKLANEEKAQYLKEKEVALLDEQIKNAEEKGFVNQARVFERKKLQVLGVSSEHGDFRWARS